MPTGLESVAGKTIAIDAGHNGGNAGANRRDLAADLHRDAEPGGDTTGTQTNDGYPEHAYTLDVALRLQAILAAAGANVVMSRTTDTGVGPCIDERAFFGNRAHAAVGISIHADGGPSTGRGST